MTQNLVQRRIVCFYGISARAAVNLKPLLQQLLNTVRTLKGLSPLHPLSLWAATPVWDLTTRVCIHLSKGQGVKRRLW